ncbi:Zn-dependent hydrolase [Neisseriaceae bacterium TC5R-5]|nr:Zn-dependent hydrolase [Neisseriaceae bacterium TC5R-5]
MTQAIQINSQRLLQWSKDFAAIGATAKGGVTRLALTDVDKQARDLFVQLAQAAGCSIKIDAIGNIFARRAGRHPDNKPVLTGSHGDSQPQGGRFDGIYGVLAGLEVLYTLNDHQISTEHPIDLVMWTNEEGSRFAPALIGSSVFIGQTALAEALATCDSDGHSMAQELERIGYAGRDDFSQYTIHASLEVHIEQGPVLENRHKTIGAVTGALGQKWYEIRFTGMAAHAGTTPMDARQDALLGLARAVDQINAIGLAEMPDGRATVGMVRIGPNSRNVVPAEAFFSVEFRHSSAAALERMDGALRQAVANIASELQLEYQLDTLMSLAPIHFNQHCVEVVRSSAEQLGYSQQDIVSGAGHDSCNISKVAPTAMIFIPCIKGISHNELEDITPEWSEAGANVLLHSLLKLANTSD